MVTGLDKNKFEVTIACGNNKGAFFALVEALGVKIHIIETTTSYRPLLTLPLRLLKIISFFRKNKFDIVHSWHWSSDWTEALAARLSGTKWMYTKKAMSWGSPRNWRLRSMLASCITTINPDMKEMYFKGMSNIKLLPLGLDTSYYKYQAKTYSFGNLSYSQDDFVIISVVNLIRAKGLEILVDALKYLHDPQIKILIVGDYSSDYGQSIYNKVQQGLFAHRIQFTGKVLDVRDYLALSDMFVTPTNVNWEGMPMAPVEAMSSGRIVVGTNTSGINYILADFPFLLVPPNEAKVMAEKILEIRNMDVDAKIKLETQIRNKVITDFSLEKFTTSYGELYQSIKNA